MGNAIFTDLEIDYSDMLSDPQEFMSRVYEAADSLKEVLRSDTSLKAMEAKFKENIQPAPVEVTKVLNDLYQQADEMPLEFLLDTIQQARKFVNDLETMFTDRCIYEAANQNNTVADKRTAHEQYMRLKDSTNQYIAALKVLKAHENYNFKPLPNMPGNYGGGSNNLIRYVFEYQGEQYRNHRVICRALEIPMGNLMDCLEYIQSHPDCGVTVKKVN
jgi:hypothetical protein